MAIAFKDESSRLASIAVQIMALLPEGLRRAMIPFLVSRLVIVTVLALVPMMAPVREAYRALHVLPATPPKGVRFYSTAWAKPYEVTTDSAADSVTDDAMHGFDFTQVVTQAWNDGVRVFIEAGPQGSCTRMISRILEGKPHLAVSACQRGQDGYLSLLQAVAKVADAGVPVSLDALYADVRLPTPVTTKTIVVPVGGMKSPRVEASESTGAHAYSHVTRAEAQTSPRATASHPSADSHATRAEATTS